MYTEIYDLLYSIGLSASYSGFFHTAFAVYLTLQNPLCVLLPEKYLYPKIAEQYHTSIQRVKRSIRICAVASWIKRPKRVSNLARHALPKSPTASQFITILVSTFFDSSIA